MEKNPGAEDMRLFRKDTQDAVVRSEPSVSPLPLFRLMGKESTQSTEYVQKIVLWDYRYNIETRIHKMGVMVHDCGKK